MNNVLMSVRYIRAMRARGYALVMHIYFALPIESLVCTSFSRHSKVFFYNFKVSQLFTYSAYALCVVFRFILDIPSEFVYTRSMFA